MRPTRSRILRSQGWANGDSESGSGVVDRRDQVIDLASSPDGLIFTTASKMAPSLFWEHGRLVPAAIAGAATSLLGTLSARQRSRVDGAASCRPARHTGGRNRPCRRRASDAGDRRRRLDPGPGDRRRTRGGERSLRHPASTWSSPMPAIWCSAISAPSSPTSWFASRSTVGSHPTDLCVTCGLGSTSPRRPSTDWCSGSTSRRRASTSQPSPASPSTRREADSLGSFVHRFIGRPPRCSPGRESLAERSRAYSYRSAAPGRMRTTLRSRADHSPPPPAKTALSAECAPSAASDSDG